MFSSNDDTKFPRNSTVKKIIARASFLEIEWRGDKSSISWLHTKSQKKYILYLDAKK